MGGSNIYISKKYGNYQSYNTNIISTGYNFTLLNFINKIKFFNLLFFNNYNCLNLNFFFLKKKNLLFYNQNKAYKNQFFKNHFKLYTKNKIKKKKI